jgi:hypothetical protein
MDNDNRNTQRKNIGKASTNSVNDEVRILFSISKNGKVNPQTFKNLRMKYGDEEFVEKVNRAFLEEYVQINKKAKKFAQLIREKYADSQYPFHILLEKAYKYKDKYKLNDEVFATFQTIYQQELAGVKSAEVLEPNTNLKKVLGSVNLDYQGFTKELNDSDYKIVNEIIKLHRDSKPLHSQVFLQSVQYNDCDIEAVTGSYNRDLHAVYDHIHPIIAALFIPKISVLEQHFIHSNFSGIVKSRYSDEPFTTMADALLFESVVNDPNDVVCDSRSTIVDLYNRSLLQNQVWNLVLSLRNGQYYNKSFTQFISAVDTCRINKYDTPDLIYGRYDGTILKRLLSAFSFRPTVITSIPMYTPFTTNPYKQNIRPMVTFVPMINLKLPYSNTDNDDPILLNDALNQSQMLLENNLLVQKNTSLIYSKGVLFFYIDRRTNVIFNAVNTPLFAFPKIPTASAGFDRINKRLVNFDTIIRLKNDIYHLRSVVINEVNQLTEQKDIVVGSSALIMQHQNHTNGRYVDEFLKYDPQCVVKPSIINDLVSQNFPIDIIGGSGDDKSFTEMARSRGVIFMYELVVDDSTGIISF